MGRTGATIAGASFTRSCFASASTSAATHGGNGATTISDGCADAQLSMYRGVEGRLLPGGPGCNDKWRPACAASAIRAVLNSSTKGRQSFAERILASTAKGFRKSYRTLRPSRRGLQTSRERRSRRSGSESFSMTDFPCLASSKTTRAVSRYFLSSLCRLHAVSRNRRPAPRGRERADCRRWNDRPRLSRIGRRGGSP